VIAIKNISLHKQKIILGSDHAGFKVKERLKKYFKKKHILYEDLGTSSEKPADYPDYAFKVAQKVSKNKNTKGILICGTGTGMVIAANKIKGIRAVSAYDAYSAKMSRLDNNANVLGLRGRNFPYKKIEKIVLIWLKTTFSKKAKHQRRIRKISRRES